MDRKNCEQRKKTVFERNKFFATTSIAGFGLINSSNSRVETAIWYSVILIFSALTIGSIVELTYEYRNQQPIATVRIERWNGEIENIIIRLEIENFPFLYNELYFKYPYNKTYNRSLSYDLDQEVISKFDTKERLIGSKVAWPHILLSLMTKYFAAMGEFENYLNRRTAWRVRLTNIDGFKFIKRFLDHCEQLNVTNKELIDKWFNQYMAMVLVTYGDNKENNVPLQLYRFDASYFSLPDMTLYIRSGRKIVLDFFMRFTNRKVNEILLKSGVFGENGTLDYIRNWKYKFSQSLYFYIGDTYNAYGAFEINTKHRSSREVNAIYSFQSASENCSSMTSTECVNECESTFFIDNCHCDSLFSIGSYDNFIPCTLDHYEKCDKTSNCYKEKCPAQCNQKVVSLDRILYDNSTYYTDDMLFELSWKVASYPAFKEIRSMSLRSYLAKLGGEFNFWIGASVISAIHLIVYITKQLVYTFKKNTKTGTNLRHLIRGLRTGNDHNQTVNLLTLGIRQQSTDYIIRQTPEKLQEIQILTEQMEILKNDTKQQGRQIEEMKKTTEQVSERQENMSQEIKKITEQVADIQENISQEMKKIFAEQREFLKHFVTQQQEQQQLKKISE